MLKCTSRLLALIALAVGAKASVLTWSVSGTFVDGGAFGGSFSYDASMNIYSDIDITTSPGSSFIGAHYSFLGSAGGFAPKPSEMQALTSNAVNQGGLPALHLGFTPPLSDFGGTVASSWYDEGICFNAACSAIVVYRVINGGTAVAVPEPDNSTFALFGLLGLSLAVRGRGGRRTALSYQPN
jgi:hypothetical protein